MLILGKRLILMLVILGVLGSMPIDSFAERISFAFEVGLPRYKADNGVVSGDTSNPAFVLSIGYGKYLELGYFDTWDILNSSVENNSGISATDGWTIKARDIYLRVKYPCNETFTGFVQVGRSKTTIEGTSTSLCLFFCSNPGTFSTETDYNDTQSSTSIGIGFEAKVTRRGSFVFQYSDLAYNEDFDFSGFYIGYRMTGVVNW